MAYEYRVQQKCEICKKPIQQSDTRGRTKKYCSPACKQQSYTKAKQEREDAEFRRELARDGVVPEAHDELVKIRRATHPSTYLLNTAVVAVLKAQDAVKKNSYLPSVMTK